MATKSKKTALKKSTPEITEKDSVYLLKLVLYFVLGCMWVQFDENGIAIPIGLIFGVLLASHDHFQVDRKIEFAILLIATILSFIAPIGFVLNV